MPNLYINISDEESYTLRFNLAKDMKEYVQEEAKFSNYELGCFYSSMSENKRIAILRKRVEFAQMRGKIC